MTTDPALSLSADTLAQLAADSARAGDVQTLALVLAGGVPVGTTTPRGESLPMLAAYHDRLDAMRLLLELESTEKGLHRSVSPPPSTAPTWSDGSSTTARRATCAMPQGIARWTSPTPSAPLTPRGYSETSDRLAIAVAHCRSRLPIVHRGCPLSIAVAHCHRSSLSIAIAHCRSRLPIADRGCPLSIAIAHCRSRLPIADLDYPLPISITHCRCVCHCRLSIPRSPIDASHPVASGPVSPPRSSSFQRVRSAPRGGRRRWCEPADRPGRTAA